MERSLRHKYIVNRGDSFIEPLELVDENGDFITDEWTWRFTVRKELPETDTTNDDDAEISKSGTFTDGKDTLNIDSSETELDPKTYYFDYQLKKPDGSIHSTKYGYFVIEEDVTRNQES